MAVSKQEESVAPAGQVAFRSPSHLGWLSCNEFFIVLRWQQTQVKLFQNDEESALIEAHSNYSNYSVGPIHLLLFLGKDLSKLAIIKQMHFSS